MNVRILPCAAWATIRAERRDRVAMTARAIFVAAPPGINRLLEQMPAAHEEANPLGRGRATTELIDRFAYALHRRQDKFFSLISEVADDAWSEEAPSSKRDRNDNRRNGDLAQRSHYRRFSIYAIREARTRCWPRNTWGASVAQRRAAQARRALRRRLERLVQLLRVPSGVERQVGK